MNRRLLTLLATLTVALSIVVPATARADAATVVGYANGGTIGGALVGVGPIMSIPDPSGPASTEVAYPAPVPTTPANDLPNSEARKSFAVKSPVSPDGVGGFCNGHYSSWDGAQDNQGSGYPFNEIAGYIVHMPTMSDSYNWRACTATLGTGYNSFCVSIQSPPANAAWIVQICPERGTMSTRPDFFYSYDDENGGHLNALDLPGNSCLQDPCYGDSYYFQVHNYSSGGGNYYWYYCMNDMTQGTGTVCLYTNATWTSGTGAWVAGETWEQNDLMGHYTQVDTYHLYAPHDRRTNQSSGTYMGSGAICWLHSSGYQGAFRCTSESYNGWLGFYPWTAPF